MRLLSFCISSPSTAESYACSEHEVTWLVEAIELVAGEQEKAVGDEGFE